MSEEPTSAQLEEMTRRGIELSNRGDYDTLLLLYSPDAVWDMSTTGLGVFEGRTAIKAFFEDWAASFDDFAVNLVEFRDFGRGVTLGVVSQRGQPPGGGGFVEQPYVAVGTLEDGLITRVTVYVDIDEACAAAERLAEERA
jgi:ketosteroid isomerase-like protein